ncbi:MAG: hypothetical protein ACE5GD_10010 [Candidatus Geothermarchaeales archaeon]
MERIIDELKHRRVLENPKIRVQIRNVVTSTKLLDGIDSEPAVKVASVTGESRAIKRRQEFNISHLR